MKKMIKFALTSALMSVSALSMAHNAEQFKPIKKPVSVHVLNLKTGIPSEGVVVVLDKKEGDK